MTIINGGSRNWLKSDVRPTLGFRSEGDAISVTFDPHPTSANASEADRSATKVVASSRILLEDLLVRSLILRDDWEALPETMREELHRQGDSELLLKQLIEQKLLTAYQAERIRTGKLRGLYFGNYRVLDRLGAGGMGVVYRAEHVLLRRLAALKVLPNPFDEDIQILSRFLVEIRSVAQLQHPNIVAALDADRTRGSELEPAGWYYLVMEYIPGEDLDRLVRRRGPLPLVEACDLVCQIASALVEAHKHGLIHRDIKPSNVLVTPEGQAKLLDFGLARRMTDRHLTEPGAVLGTLDFMSPEQATTTAEVDHRADIYALGGILCWCLTGKPPFAQRQTTAQQLLARQVQTPPSLRIARPELPEALDAIVERLMAVRPDSRYPTAQAAIGALLPFLAPAYSPQSQRSWAIRAAQRTAVPAATDEARIGRILVIDDDALIRKLYRRVLEGEGLQCDEAFDGQMGLEMVRAQSYDLVLLDINMPNLTGPEVLHQLRTQPPCPNLKIIMLSGAVSSDEMASLLAAGADDYLPKPPSIVQFAARVKAALSHKEAQDRSDMLNTRLLAINAELERGAQASASDLAESRNALLLSLAELAEMRAGQPVLHLARLQRFARLLAVEAADSTAFTGQIDANFIAMLECCAPLHDIGLAALPDHVLHKVGKYDHDERLVMQSHTTIGADILLGIARKHRSAVALLQMAADIARHHHESYNGQGYPDRLSGNAIPLAARIVALADTYDALRSARPQRPALSHQFAIELMTEGSPGRFDPNLIQVFVRIAGQFDRIVREMIEG